MVESISRVETAALPEVSSPKGSTAARQGNVKMVHKSDKYIETENYIRSRKEICAKHPELNKVFNSVDCIIGQDGSVTFRFKANVNVEQFKKAFGIGDGALRGYLRMRHDKGVKNGTVKAHYTNGARTNDQQRAIYETSGNGARISYSDGYTETKGPRGGWINRSKIVDHPDYTRMTLGPADNEGLGAFSKDFFNYDD